MTGRRPVWRLIVDGARAGAANMAIDEALFESVQAGDRPVLRLYHWDPPCLSLGRNQIADRALAARAAAGGAHIVRRPTGGLAVYHDREVTYAVIGSIAHLGRPRAAYARINRALVAAIRALGVNAALADGAGPAGPGAGLPCFAGAAEGEVTVAGRKLVGSAQRCVSHAILQHGSILLDGDQRAADVRMRPPARVEPDDARHAMPTSLAEAIGREPGRGEVQARVIAAFQQEFGIILVEDGPTEAERARARALTTHYASEAWTWRL